MKRIAAAVLAAAIAQSAFGRAQSPGVERIPARPRLRLDESQVLSLLAPFRHASDRTRTHVGNWRNGPFGAWQRRSLSTLDWEAEGASPLPGGVNAPINPNVGASDQAPCEQRLNAAMWRWPFVLPGDHWFNASAGDGMGLDGAAFAGATRSAARSELALEARWMPPWLTQVDAHWAHALVLRAGCGRGGACSAGVAFPAAAFMSLWDAMSPEVLPPPWWECRERPLAVHRLGSEKQAFVVLGCDGSIPDGALESLSVLARPHDVPKPAELPVVALANGEWAAGVRVMHPRLMWVLHQVALAFPWHAVHIYSGYRPAAQPIKPGSHTSQHAYGRALDISVQGVDNEELLALCHRLPDVGCGYYPNGKFVHLDIRFRGRGLWVDASAPGEPSRYVNGWDGVVEAGRVIWKKKK